MSVSLRDYLAARALPAAMAALPQYFVGEAHELGWASVRSHETRDGQPWSFAQELAADAYIIADAMMIERDYRWADR